MGGPGRDPTGGGGGRPELPQNFIRVVIGALALASAAFALLADKPEKLPSVALGQIVLYRAELLLAALFTGLLIVTPVLQGILNGRLPTEISARGAKYDPQEVSQSLASLEARIQEVDQTATAASALGLKLRSEISELQRD